MRRLERSRSLGKKWRSTKLGLVFHVGARAGILLAARPSCRCSAEAIRLVRIAWKNALPNLYDQLDAHAVCKFEKRKIIHAL